MQRARVAFKGELADEVVHGIGDIGAFNGLRSVRDDEQPRKRHGMIDPQRSSMAHVGGGHLIKEGIGGTLPGGGLGGCKPQFWPCFGEGVGRRADGAGPHQLIGVGPASAPSGAAPTARSR